jgi:hypothetical protein
MLDLFRVDEDGRPLLTLRKVAVLIRFLPSTSALAIAANGGKEPWRLEHYLLTDLWVVAAKQLGGKKAPDHHPWRVEQNKKSNAIRVTSKRAAYAKSKARLDAQRRARQSKAG